MATVATEFLRLRKDNATKRGKCQEEARLSWAKVTSSDWNSGYDGYYDYGGYCGYSVQQSTFLLG